MKRLLLVLVFVACAVPAFAQNPVNPTQVQFDLDPAELAGLSGVELGYFAVISATVPVQVSSAIPLTSGCALNGAVQTCTEPLASRPSAFQTWFLGARAVATSGVKSAWSSPLVPFDRAPSAPTNLRPR